MWNSPHKLDEFGLRYDIVEIAALVYPVGLVVDMVKESSPAYVFEEGIVCRMGKEEFVFALYEVLQALLEDIPIPEKGHPGYQEAIVFELLNACYGQIETELYDSEFGDRARKAAWTSFDRLCLQSEIGEEIREAIFEELTLDFSDPAVHRSELLTSEIWYEIVVGESGVSDQFFWDYDYRIDKLMDLPESMTKEVLESTGIDLEVVHKLPHTPTDSEFRTADSYIRNIDRKLNNKK